MVSAVATFQVEPVRSVDRDEVGAAVEGVRMLVEDVDDDQAGGLDGAGEGIEEWAAQALTVQGAWRGPVRASGSA